MRIPYQPLINKTLLLLSMGAASVAQAIEPAQIQVNSMATVEAMPDYVNVAVTIEKIAPKKANPKQQVDKNTAQVLSVLKNLNIDNKHIQAAEIFSQPEYRWTKDKQEYVGERVNRTVQVKLYKLENYSTLAEQLMALDITRYEQRGAGFDNIDTFRNQALLKAIDAAKTKAGLIAKQVNRTLGDVQTVQESGGNSAPNFPQPVYAKAMMMSEQAQPPIAPLEIKAQTIEAAVNMVFLLK